VCHLPGKVRKSKYLCRLKILALVIQALSGP
jgi:hypothetical protein